MLYLIGSVLFAMATGAALSQHAYDAALTYGIFCALFLLADCVTYNKED